MICGIIDIGCALHKLIDPIWFYLYWGFWVVVALVALSVLYRVKVIFGWQGVATAIAATVAALIAIFSFKAGRNSVTPVEGDFDAPVRPKRPRKPRKPVTVDEKNKPGTFNHETGTWNE